VKGVPFSIKDIQKGHLFSQNGIHKGKGLDLWAEPHSKKLCRAPPPPLPLLGD